MPESDGTQADVDVGKRDPKQARPRPLLMSRIQQANEVVYLVPHRVGGDAVKRATDEVPERVTPEYIAGKKDDVDDKHEAPYSDPESVRKEEPPDGVVDQKSPDNVGEPQKIAMKILHDQRKTSFAQIRLARLAHGARRRVRPERLVIRPAIVIAGHAEQAGDPENEQRRRERKKARIPSGFRAEQGVRRASKQLRRIKRRNIGAKGVVAVLESRPVGVDQKRGETQEDRRRRKPPGITPRCLGELAVFPNYVGS